MLTRFIGDVHGKFSRYQSLIEWSRNSVQVGDMGVGFIDLRTGWYLENPPYRKMLEGNHRFIRGNHDNPTVCRNHSQCIADGTVEGDVMFVGGAGSIDKAYRIEGYSWWPDEEISSNDLNLIVDIYDSTRPRVMVTHDCPESVVIEVCPSYRREFDSRTRQFLQSMLDKHRPELWVFGHWHTSFDRVVDGTRFVCLNELETLDVDL